jgi:hypothetical protein
MSTEEMTTEQQPTLVGATAVYHPEAAPPSQPTLSLTSSIEEMEKRFGFAKKIAQLMADSALVPKDFQGSPANCFIAIQMGAELGLGPFQAVQSIAVVNGRPSVWGDALLGLVRASGKLVHIREWIEKTDDGRGEVAHCEVMRRGDKEPTLRSFSMQDAARASLLKKPIWMAYPLRMLQMRARAYALRDAFADVMKGISVAEEMQDAVYIDQSMASAPTPAEPSAGPTKPNLSSEAKGAEAASDYDALSEALMQATSISALLKLKPRIRDYPDDADREVLQKLYNQRRDEVKK